MVLRLKPMGKLMTCGNHLGTRQNQNLFPLSIKYSHSFAWVLGPDDPQTSQAPPPFRPRWRKMAAVRNTFKGLRGRNSSGRLVLVPSNSLEQLNEALARANPQKTEPRSCMILGLKPIGKLITRDKYLSVRQNQGLAWSLNSNLWEN